MTDTLFYSSKDRFLNTKKKRWFKTTIKRRECVQFVPIDEALSDRYQQGSGLETISGMTSGSSNTQTTNMLQATDLSQQGESSTNVHRPKPSQARRKSEAAGLKMCRCGRLFTQHIELSSEPDRSRDYRIFSKEFPTDVCVELVHTKLRKRKPHSYSPIQVVRLAADTHSHILEELIGEIWMMPKSAFMVSVHGSCAGLGKERYLTPHLNSLLRVLSMPGSVVVTMAVRDLEMYRDTLKACEIQWCAMPHHEVTPFIFLPWTDLTDKEKKKLHDWSSDKYSVDYDHNGTQISAFRGIQQMAYFMLVDYGVHAEMPELNASSVDHTAWQTSGTHPAEKYRYFRYSCPHPLRAHVEKVLKAHTRDPEGQATVLIMYGNTNFMDLVMAHGAISSGIPVIWDYNGQGTTRILLNVMKDLNLSKGHTEIIPETRNIMLNVKDVKKTFQHYIKFSMKTYRAKQMLRMIIDILNSLHLLTIYNFNTIEPPFAGVVVEALLRGRTTRDAMTFAQKNIRCLAAEEDGHPVKEAQRTFQFAVIKAAMHQNRPELLDTVVDQGFVSEFEVYREHSRKYLNEEERTCMLAGKNIPFSKIKDMECFDARECFVQRTCKLKHVPSLDERKPSIILHQLFLHAVLNGHTKLAKHFWKQPVFQDQIVHALVTSLVSNYMATSLPSKAQKEIFKQQAEDFQQLAMGTLDECIRSDPKKASTLVNQKAEAFGLSPIETAVSFEMLDFVAHPASSDFLESVWRGQHVLESTKEMSSDNYYTCTSCWSGQICCCNRNQPPTDASQSSEWNLAKPFLEICSLMQFFTSPRGICYTSTVTYVCFLVLYGHSIIFRKAEYSDLLMYLDIALFMWVFSFLVEELVQMVRPRAFLATNVTDESTLCDKLASHFADRWNVLDTTNIAFFMLGWALRFFVPSVLLGHVILSLVYISYVLRILHVFTASRSVGPMLPMIWSMLGDMGPFLLILFIFVIAYGMVSEALLHPKTSWSILYLLYLPRAAFWPIFGEYKLDEIDGMECQNDTLWYLSVGNQVMCPTSVGRHMVPVLMGVYVLITNVLMLNLLIAKFNYSFEKVRNESNIWWAWFRLGLIREYYARPALPIPLVLPYRMLYSVFWILKTLFWGLCWITFSLWKLCREIIGSSKEKANDSNQKQRIQSFVDFENQLLLSTSQRLSHEFEQHELPIDDVEEIMFLLDDMPFRPQPGGLKSLFPQTYMAVSMTDLQKFEATNAARQMIIHVAQEESRIKQSDGGRQPKLEDFHGQQLRLEKTVEDHKSVLIRLERKMEDCNETLKKVMDLCQVIEKKGTRT